MLPPLPKLPLCSPHIRVTIKCVISCPFLSPLPVGQETEVSSGSEEPITLCNLRCMCWLLWSTEPFIGPTPANPGFLPLLKCFLFLSLAVLRSRVIFFVPALSHMERRTHAHINTHLFSGPTCIETWMKRIKRQQFTVKTRLMCLPAACHQGSGLLYVVG